MAVKPIPDGYHAVTPYLIVAGAVQALDYYRSAFGAEEIMRYADQDGRLGHAEMRIGNSMIMLADEYPEMGYKGPRAYGGSPTSLVLYVENVDQVFTRAVDAGAKVLRPVQDQPYGDRTGTLEDPFGHVWTVATHKEDLSVEEIRRRSASK